MVFQQNHQEEAEVAGIFQTDLHKNMYALTFTVYEEGSIFLWCLGLKIFYSNASSTMSHEPGLNYLHQAAYDRDTGLGPWMAATYRTVF